MAAFCGEKSRHLDRSADRDRLQPLGWLRKRNNGDLTLHLPHHSGLGLLRGMLEQPFAYRNPRRRVAQRLALDQPAGELDAVQSFSRAITRCAAGSSAATATAAGATSAATSPPNKERDFSSFIIGEGVVRACFILTVR